MVHYCVAYGCKTVYSKDNTHFHVFPFKRPEILKLWIAAVRRKDWQPSRSNRLCSKHFHDADYQVRPGAAYRLLKKDAVPSIFNFPKYLQKRTTSRRVLNYKIEDKIDVSSQEVKNMAVEDRIEKKEAATQTNESSDRQSIQLLHKIKALQEIVRTKVAKIHSMETLIKDLKKKRMHNR